jgi:deazaflavin-dependent oxidoreductase (nitroreductase family)
MPEKIRELSPPRGLSRAFFRFPIYIYRLGLGGIFGKRMLLLNHTGRVSGLPRQAMLEVVNHDPDTGTFVVNAGFGPDSDWYRNLMAHPDASIVVGRKKIDVRAEQLAPTEAGPLMLNFVRQHPQEARFVRQLGYEVDGSDEDWIALGEELILIALRPR